MLGCLVSLIDAFPRHYEVIAGDNWDAALGPTPMLLPYSAASDTMLAPTAVRQMIHSMLSDLLGRGVARLGRYPPRSAFLLLPLAL